MPGRAREDRFQALAVCRGPAGELFLNDREIARLELDIRIPGTFDGGQRELLEQAAGTCPVSATLEGALEIRTRWEWDE